MGQLDQMPGALTPEPRPAPANAAPPVLDRVVQGTHRASDKMAERAAPKVQQIAERASRVRSTGDEWVEDLRSTVREKPLSSLITALMLGVVLERLAR